MSTNKLATNNRWLFCALEVNSELSGFLASELEAEKDVEEAIDIKGPEEAEDFEENDSEEPNDEEQNALSEQEGKQVLIGFLNSSTLP